MDYSRQKRTGIYYAVRLSLMSSAAVAGAGHLTMATAQDGAASGAPEELVVTARNRSERVQDVPVPISVLGGDQIDRDRAFTVADLAQHAPGLTATTPNARRTGISVRGIGKTSGDDNMEAAVGLIVDDVFMGHVGMSYQDFTDLERVEILRGPQGTLLGKNTTLGVIKYTSRGPSFKPEALVDMELGADPRASNVRGSYSNGIIDDVLAYRVSIFSDKQDGDIVNVNPAVGGRWQERNRYGGRAQLLFQPSEKLSVKFDLDAASSNENSNVKPFMVDPATLDDGSVRTTTYSTRLARSYFGGYTPIIGSWSTIDLDNAKPVETDNRGFSSVINWDIGNVKLTSVSAARRFHFDAGNDQEQTRFTIARNGTLVDTDQVSQELRLTGSAGRKLDYQAGVYLFNIKTETTSRTWYGADAGAFFAANNQYTALAAQPDVLKASLDNVFVTMFKNPETDSRAAFGQVDWHFTERATLTLGLRKTWEDKTSGVSKVASFTDGSPLVSTGNATADAIRVAQVGAQYAGTGVPIDSDAYSWLVNPSFRLTDDVLLYASVASGEKSGAVQFASANGAPLNVNPEKSLNYEFGIKSFFHNHKLMLNANLYQTTVEDYQAITSQPDPTAASGYVSILGNIPEIRARGVELDAVYNVTSNLRFNFGTAYNDAVYTDWSIATCPRNVPATTPFCDNTGKQIVGAPKWTAIIGVDYERQVGRFIGRAFANHVYRSEQNLEQLLSPYGYQGDYTVTDVGIGISRQLRGFTYDLNLVGKNVFDTHYTTSVNDFSNNQPVGFDGIGPRRFVGVDLRLRF